MKNSKQLLGRALLFGWAVAFAYFFGQLLWGIMPFQWPFNVIAGYTGGIVAGLLFAYFILGKVKPLASQIIIALVMLIFVGAVSAAVVRLAYQNTVMGLEIQELRDEAARKNLQ